MSSPPKHQTVHPQPRPPNPKLEAEVAEIMEQYEKRQAAMPQPIETPQEAHGGRQIEELRVCRLPTGGAVPPFVRRKKDSEAKQPTVEET